MNKVRHKGIKFFLVTLAAASCFGDRAMAQDTSGFHQEALKWVNTARSFMERTEKCYLAIMNFPNEEATQKTDLWALPGFKPRSVTCIADVVSRGGTIHEVSGCGLVTFHLETGKYGPYGRYINDKQIIVPLDCNKGGFEKLLSEKIESMFYGKERPAVAEEIFSPPLGQIAAGRFVFIYSKDKKTKAWFDEQGSKMASVQKAMKEKQKKERAVAAENERRLQEKKAEAERIEEQKQERKRKEREKLWE